MVIEELIEISKQDEIPLEKPAKIIAQKLEILHTNGTPNEQPQENNVITKSMQQQYSVIT